MSDVIRLIIGDEEVSGRLVGVTTHAITVRMDKPYEGLVTTTPRHSRQAPEATQFQQAQTGLATLFEKATEFLERRDEIESIFDEAMQRLHSAGLGESREEAFDAYEDQRRIIEERKRNRELNGKEAEDQIARMRSGLIERYAELAQTEEEMCRDIFGPGLSLADVKALRDHFRGKPSG